MTHRFTVLATLLVFVLLTDHIGAVPLPGGDFEDGGAEWTIREPEAMTRVVTEQAGSGRRSLKVEDKSEKNGSSATSPRVPIEARHGYELRGNVFMESGNGLGIYLHFFDADGKQIDPDDPPMLNVGGPMREWHPLTFTFYTPSNAATVALWIHSYSSARVTLYLDDLEIVPLGPDALRPPWEGTYKIDPAAHPEKLAPADVVGPDGIVYPNWTRVGVEGGIPQVADVVSIADFGGTPDDNLDDADALDRACQAAAQKGGGAVRLEAGTYHLDRPVTIRSSNVVIRGRGADQTAILFRYNLGDDGIRFYGLADGATVGPDTVVELHALPTGLQTMEIRAGDKRVGQWSISTHSGNTFYYTLRGRDVLSAARPGPLTLTGVATYQDGSTRRVELPIVLDPEHRGDPPPDRRGAITFAGAGATGPQIKLARDGARGDMTLTLTPDHGLAVGDKIMIDGPATERWKQITRNACPWGSYRRYEVRISGVNGQTVSLEQPLRIDFPVIDGSYVRKINPIERCGIEDLSIEQTENLWITTVLFSNAWNCWARGVTVRMCGRNPVYSDLVKFCEIRDCVFDDAWFKGGGGTAYAGWERSYDCLMENVETFNFRHAPLVQWSASGNVIRNGTFHNSDAQWHSGWTNENLLENCIVFSSNDNGAYGYGMWASPPEDTAHGPNGPRNVVYNCDITSPRAGLWMGGMNENWLILYNRFDVADGPGVFMKTASFDHIIRGNVFQVRDRSEPMVEISTPDCIGVEITDNTLIGGNGTIAGGIGVPATLDDNTVRPPGTSGARPRPPVPSIYEWQQQNVKR